MALTDKLTAIGNAIRSKTGGTDLIPLADMPAAIEGISGGGSGFWPGGKVTITADFERDSGIILLYNDMTSYYIGGDSGMEYFGIESDKNVLVAFGFYPYMPSLPGITVPHFEVVGEYEFLTTGLSGKAYKILGDCTFTYVS